MKEFEALKEKTRCEIAANGEAGLRRRVTVAAAPSANADFLMGCDFMSLFQRVNSPQKNKTCLRRLTRRCAPQSAQADFVLLRRIYSLTPTKWLLLGGALLVSSPASAAPKRQLPPVLPPHSLTPLPAKRLTPRVDARRATPKIRAARRKLAPLPKTGSKLSAKPAPRRPSSLSATGRANPDRQSIGLADQRLQANAAAPLFSLEDAIALSLANNPRRDEAQAAVNAATANIGAVGAQGKFQVSANGTTEYGRNTATSNALANATNTSASSGSSGGTGSNGGTGSSGGTGGSGTTASAPSPSRSFLRFDQLTVGASEPIYDGGRVRASTRQARYQAVAQIYQLAQTEQDLILGTTLGYLDVLRSAQLLRVTNANLSVSQERLRIARLRFGVGASARLDVLRAETDLANARTLRIAAVNALGTSNSNLNILLGRAPETPLRLVPITRLNLPNVAYNIPASSVLTPAQNGQSQNRSGNTNSGNTNSGNATGNGSNGRNATSGTGANRTSTNGTNTNSANANGNSNSAGNTGGGNAAGNGNRAGNGSGSTTNSGANAGASGNMGTTGNANTAAASGNAASGNAASGNAASGNAASGNAASGNAASGNAASGNAASGNAASGNAATTGTGAAGAVFGGGSAPASNTSNATIGATNSTTPGASGNTTNQTGAAGSTRATGTAGATNPTGAANPSGATTAGTGTTGGATATTSGATATGTTGSTATGTTGSTASLGGGNVPSSASAGLQGLAGSTRQSLAVTQAQIGAAEAAVEIAKTGKRPQLGLNLSALLRNPATFLGNFGASIGLGLAQNLFDSGRTRNQVDTARAALTQLQARLAGQRLEVAGAIETSLLSLDSAQRRQLNSETGVRSAREALRVAQIGFRSGVRTTLDLADAQAALLSAQTDAVNARFDVADAQATLAAGVGIYTVEAQNARQRAIRDEQEAAEQARRQYEILHPKPKKKRKKFLGIF